MAFGRRQRKPLCGGGGDSWGQHFLGWESSEFWQDINDQSETNLHNTSSWLDQKPRLILEIGVMVGGIVIPLLIKFKKGLLPARFNEFIRR